MAKEPARDKRRTCFVIGPIGSEGSDIRLEADWLYEFIIEPVMDEHSEFDVVRSDKLSRPGLIDSQVINLLYDAELVIADLTDMNPNVFYEIGIRHMRVKPIIHMLQATQKPPFDVSLQRTIMYSRATPSDIKKARVELGAQVKAVLAEGFEVVNPVTNARGRLRLEEHATPEQQLMMNEMRELSRRVVAVEAVTGIEQPYSRGFTTPRHARGRIKIEIAVPPHLSPIEEDVMLREIRNAVAEWSGRVKIIGENRVSVTLPRVDLDVAQLNLVLDRISQVPSVLQARLVDS